MVDRILHLHGFLAYLIVFALPALEASVFLGFVFPGEIAVLLGGVLAFEGRISLAGAIGCAIAGAIIGDSVGYEVGKRFGPRLLDGPLRRFVGPHHRERATAFLHRHRGKAVFLGRFTAALRVLVPGLAGMAGIPYGTFLLYNVLGGVAWATAFTFAGYAAGNGYRRVEHILGRASLLLLGILAVVGLVVWGARWVARHPDRVRARWARVLERPVVRRFRRQLEFLGARLRPGQAFGLELTAGAVAAALIGIAFGVILRDVASRQELVRVDDPILAALIRHADPEVTGFMRTMSALGSTMFVSIASGVIAVAFATRRRWLRATLAIAAPAGATALYAIVGALVRRRHPPVRALAHVGGYSFPSGHATVAIAFYGTLAYLAARSVGSWKLKVTFWTAAAVVAGLIGFSRMYLRVHYFTDVVGGFALGGVWLAVALSAAGVFERRARAAAAAPV